MKIPQNVNRNIEGQYCLQCQSPKVLRIFKDGKTYYFCDNCQTTHERSLVIDNAIHWWIDSKDNYWHESVGVLILNENNELLAIMRKVYPFAYSLPAGHVDKDEKPLVAVQREVDEELKITLSKKDFNMVNDFELPGDSCRRGSDHHLWHLYLAKIKCSEHTIHLNDEADSFQWFDINEIAKRNDVTYPLQYIVKNFKDKILKLTK